MRVAVASCHAYRDAWTPFFQLFEKFWPEFPGERWLLTDNQRYWWDRQRADDSVVPVPQPWRVFARDASWCQTIAAFCDQQAHGEPVILFQEDFFISEPVRATLVEYAYAQMVKRRAGMVRLYPCPGGDVDYGDPLIGIMSKGSRYRISCQVSIWQPEYLYKLAATLETPHDFEIIGSMYSHDLPEEVLAVKRGAPEWPIKYLCSAISRGQWNPAAKQLCEQHGIEVDFSRRGMLPH